jgi:hypothetical protein
MIAVYLDVDPPHSCTTNLQVICSGCQFFDPRLQESHGTDTMQRMGPMRRGASSQPLNGPTSSIAWIYRYSVKSSYFK